MANEIRPQASLMVCDNLATVVGANTLVMIGVFDGVKLAVFPGRVTFYCVAKIWGLEGGEHTVALRLVDATGKAVAEAGVHNFRTGGPNDVHTAVSQFRNVALPTSGAYELRAYRGDAVIGQLPFNAGSAKG